MKRPKATSQKRSTTSIRTRKLRYIRILTLSPPYPITDDPYFPFRTGKSPAVAIMFANFWISSSRRHTGWPWVGCRPYPLSDDAEREVWKNSSLHGRVASGGVLLPYSQGFPRTLQQRGSSAHDCDSSKTINVGQASTLRDSASGMDGQNGRILPILVSMLSPRAGVEASALQLACPRVGLQQRRKMSNSRVGPLMVWSEHEIRDMYRQIPAQEFAHGHAGAGPSWSQIEPCMMVRPNWIRHESATGAGRSVACDSESPGERYNEGRHSGKWK